jgi:hypothetical protein
MLAKSEPFAQPTTKKENIMKRSIAAMAAVFGVGLCAAPVFAAEQDGASAEQPSKLSDGELEQVKGGDPLIYIGIGAPIDVHIEPITVNIPVNVAAIIQANVLGNSNFSAFAVGRQNNYNFTFTPGG